MWLLSEGSIIPCCEAAVDEISSDYTMPFEKKLFVCTYYLTLKSTLKGKPT